jgi:DNA repair photolyase
VPVQVQLLQLDSNIGYYLRIHAAEFAERAKEQVGLALGPYDDPDLMYVWPEILERLETQLARHKVSWGTGKTCVFSMLTDAFSPYLVIKGVTEGALRLVLERSSFRIRVLTKNATVGSERWINFFRSYPGRFVVGLSNGTADDAWAKKVELGTSVPSARIRALNRLQEAGIPTFGMLCPVFPDVLAGNTLEELVDALRPQQLEHVWAEPFNDRRNWHHVRDGYLPGSPGYRWLTAVYEKGDYKRWSAYATELYVRLRDKARRDGWLPKLRYLLYERHIHAQDAQEFRGLAEVWLQGKPDAAGKSQNAFIRALQ